MLEEEVGILLQVSMMIRCWIGLRSYILLLCMANLLSQSLSY